MGHLGQDTTHKLSFQINEKKMYSFKYFINLQYTNSLYKTLYDGLNEDWVSKKIILNCQMYIQ